ncbi:MAG TPA: PD-(D/E)XK nuclease family protein, partial [Candidatus Acidoferrum sp.]|nr:PD-(D/E)XK nuclease family protein [Candidatus Acidoferrum sp.]
ILVRTSERQAFLTCRQKWEWSWVDKLRAPTTDTKLLFGDLVHQSLAAYYKRGRKRGPHPRVTFERLCEKLSDEQDTTIWEDDQMVDMRELGIDMLDRYVEHWREVDKEYRVISSEQTFKLSIGRIAGKKVYYVGTIDGVWQHLPTLKYRFAEHKTTTAISKSALPMDEQVGAYWTYGPRWLRLKGFLKEDERLDGIIYNWLRKTIKNGTYDEQGRKLNKDGSPSKRQPPAYFARQLTFRGDFEAERVKERVHQEVIDMLAARENPAMIYKNPGPQFMPNCKFCSFRDMCELHETGNDWLPFKRKAFVHWEPYDPYERVERM